MVLSISLRKKGGIFIKNKLIFLITIIFIFFGILNVHAETASFYEGEYIDNIYQTKYNTNTKVKYYQKARFFRRSGDNQPAYCLEPFNMFKNTTYTSTITPRKLSSEQMDRIKKLIYYGYGYANHTENKWYAVTQLMIWQTAEPGGNYYFTDKLNGNMTNLYCDEVSEINNLIELNNIKPSIINKDYYFVENTVNRITDTNHIINLYQNNSNNFILDGNDVIIKNLPKGDYDIPLYKNNTNHKKPILFYQAENTQNLVNLGDIENEEYHFRVHIINTKIQITKIDKDTNSIESPSPSASLNGAIYELTDSNNNIISKLEIKNNVAEINNLPFGTYYLKEKKAGIGYTLDNEIHKITISKDNPIIDLILTNKIIEKKITINKQYGSNNNFQSEKDISFEIYNEKNNLVKKITTNENGSCEIILPYGKYTIKQVNSTPGYTKINPFEINIDNSLEETISLKDYQIPIDTDFKVPVPDTHTSIFKYILQLIITLLLIIC